MIKKNFSDYNKINYKNKTIKHVWKLTGIYHGGGEEEKKRRKEEEEGEREREQRVTEKECRKRNHALSPLPTKEREKD